jgi:hypothetical protein
MKGFLRETFDDWVSAVSGVVCAVFAAVAAAQSSSWIQSFWLMAYFSLGVVLYRQHSRYRNELQNYQLKVEEQQRQIEKMRADRWQGRGEIKAALEDFIKKFRDFRERLLGGDAGAVERFYLTERDARIYLNQHMPAQRLFPGDEFPIQVSASAASPGTDPRPLVPRCEARIASLVQILENS